MVSVMKQAPAVEDIRNLISEIPDPEIPVITIDELGILRDVSVEDEKIVVSITPTYTGCPAMKAIENEIRERLSTAGYDDVLVRLVYSPVWTTDWLSDEAKDKLKAYGIAPPAHSQDKRVISLNPKPVTCPRCGSAETTLVSQFGSTACKALYKCNTCAEPFDYFKCH